MVVCGGCFGLGVPAGHGGRGDQNRGDGSIDRTCCGRRAERIQLREAGGREGELGRGNPGQEGGLGGVRRQGGCQGGHSSGEKTRGAGQGGGCGGRFLLGSQPGGGPHLPGGGSPLRGRLCRASRCDQGRGLLLQKRLSGPCGRRGCGIRGRQQTQGQKDRTFDHGQRFRSHPGGGFQEVLGQAYQRCASGLGTGLSLCREGLQGISVQDQGGQPRSDPGFRILLSHRTDLKTGQGDGDYHYHHGGRKEQIPPNSSR